MMLIGTSLGGCLKSILAGEVSEADVLCIISRTMCRDLDGLMHVVEEYHGAGNPFANKIANYDFTDIDLDELKMLAQRLFENGKIHQPRLYNNDSGFIHPELSRNQIWLEIAPYCSDNPAVVNAYNHYKMLSELTKDELSHQY
jgi:hypothetical protein